MRSCLLQRCCVPLLVGAFPLLARGALAIPTTSPSPDPAEPGGEARITFSGATSNADTGPFEVQGVIGIFLTEPQILTVTINGNLKSRVITLALNGRPQVGKSYQLTDDPETGPASIRYREIRATGGPDIEQMRVITKTWVSTAGTVTVTAAAGQELALEVHGAVMTAGREKDNDARGNFRLDLGCKVHGVTEFLVGSRGHLKRPPDLVRRHRNERN